MRREPNWLRGGFRFDKIVKTMMNQYVGNEPNRLGAIPGSLMSGTARSPLGMFSGKDFLQKVPPRTLPQKLLYGCGATRRND